MAKSKKPTGSLRDQLMQAGLVTSKQAKKAEKGALRQVIRVKKGVAVDEDREAADQARREKLQRDREMNAALNLKAREKALQAQVKQLMGSNSKRESGEVGYNFEDHKKIKKIYLSARNKAELNGGFLAIVRMGEGYDLVPEPVARKIAERSPDSIVYLYQRGTDVPGEDDPYKDYPIPDDLEW